MFVTATAMSNSIVPKSYVPCDIRRVPPGQVGTDRRVAAGVADEADAQAGERPVVAAAEFDVLHLAAAVGQGLHVVAARRDPHDRPRR